MEQNGFLKQEFPTQGQMLSSLQGAHISLQAMSLTAEFLREAAGHYYINYFQIDQAISGWNHRARSNLFSISYWSLTQFLRRANSYAWRDLNAGAT